MPCSVISRKRLPCLKSRIRNTTSSYSILKLLRSMTAFVPTRAFKTWCGESAFQSLEDLSVEIAIIKPARRFRTVILGCEFPHSNTAGFYFRCSYHRVAAGSLAKLPQRRFSIYDQGPHTSPVEEPNSAPRTLRLQSTNFAE